MVSQLFRQDTWSQDVHVHHHAATPPPPLLKHLLVFDQANEGVLKVKKLRTETEACMDLARPLGKTVDVVRSLDLLNCIAQYDMDRLMSTMV